MVRAVNTAETTSVSESPENTLNVGDAFTVNGQQYTVSEIYASQYENGNIVRNEFPTSVSYTPSSGTVALGGMEYGAYYPNNTIQLMTGGVHSQKLSAIRSLSERFRGLWATIVLGTLTALLILGFSYLPRRG